MTWKKRLRGNMEIEDVKSDEPLEQQYTRLCMKAGDLQYKKLCVEHELNLINQQLADLNKKAIERSKNEKPKDEPSQPSV